MDCFCLVHGHKCTQCVWWGFWPQTEICSKNEIAKEADHPSMLCQTKPYFMLCPLQLSEP